jgi:6-phosphogluconolactonase
MTTSGAASDLQVFADRQALMDAAAERVVTAAAQAIADHGGFTWALAGGSTPRELYSLLAGSAWVGRIDWSKVEFFWTDERCVPPDDVQSNYRMARETLLDTIRPAPAQVHRMRGEHEPERAAADYAEELTRALPIGRRRAPGAPPCFDLVLLGMGADGHTASLFPGSSALDERSRWVVPVEPAPGAPWRLTLTLPVLNAANQVSFLVAGAAKRDRLAQVWQAPPAPDAAALPAARVRPRSGHLVWLLDADAGAFRERRSP